MRKFAALLRSMLVPALSTIVFISFGVAQQTSLLTESFESGTGSTPPAGWVTELVSGTIPGVTFVTSAANPLIAGAPDGTKFTSYNSFDITSGATRLKQTTALSTVNHACVMVDFKWFEDQANAGATDKVDVQWSTNGSTWNTAGTFYRYNTIEGWKAKNVILPTGANNQPALFVAFLFTSAHGNNCALDDVKVTEGPPQLPSYATIGSGTVSSNYPYPTYWKGGRTQMLFTAAELLAAGLNAGEINAVGFNVKNFSSQVMNGFNLKMGATTLTSLSGYVNGLTSYYAEPYAVPGTGWRSISLTVPFTWDGISNILVEICYANTTFSTYSTVFATSQPGKTAAHYADLLTECTTSINSAPAYRPNIRLGTPVVPTGVLRGYVLDVNTLMPVSGAIVITGSMRDTTDATGAYIIYNLVQGAVSGYATVANYVPGTINGTIVPGAVTDLDILLTPGPRVSGMVTDISTGAPITGARVTIGTGASAITTLTVAGGTYLTPYLPISGAQPIVFGKTGYEDAYGTVTLVPNTVLAQDAALYPTAVQPGSVIAALNDPVAPTAVNLGWAAPAGNYELIHDDGIQENFAIWAAADNLNALKFTPLAWPVKITGGMVNLGSSANYPANALPLTPFKILAFKADGPGGVPGSVLDSVTVNSPGFGWCSFSFSSPITLNSGEFYLAVKQGGTTPHAAGTAIDETVSQSRSYSREVTAAGPWTPVSGNFMIRASLQGTGGPVLNDNLSGGDQPTVVSSYQVWRLLQGQEGNQALWTSIWTGTGTTAIDDAWPALPAGPYRWAVKAVYSPPGIRYSAPAFSNVLGNDWTANVDVCVTLSCAARPKAGTIVSLTNNAYPDTLYSKTTDTSGCVHFTNVWKGSYTLRILRFSYPLFTQVVTITGNSTFNVLLQEQPLPPNDLSVNNMSLQASWTSPVSSTTMFSENWASGSFSTNQWVTSGGSNWQISGSTGNTSPCAIFNYSPVVINYSQTLTSKSFTGSHASQMRLEYDVFLSSYGTDALNTLYVELWDGTNWNVLASYSNANGSIPWTSESVNITSVTNSPTFKIRFHATGTDSYYINNWGLDNIKIKNINGVSGSDPCLTGYNFYLGNTLLGFTPDTTYAIPPALLTYGQSYTACVTALFGTAASTPVCVTFTSYFLYAPQNLAASYVPGTTTLTWDAPLVPTGLTAYNVYRNDEFQNTVPATDVTYTDTPVPYGLNTYSVTAVYGTHESLPAGPVVINAVPILHTVGDIVVGNGLNSCYNAIQTISVAGNGTTFIVEDGGNATMIAGQNIHYFPGTTVSPGGSMWGYIAPAGPFCTSPAMPVTAATHEVPLPEREEYSFSIFPNPTSGNFTFRQKNDDQPGETAIDIYNILGYKIMSKTLHHENACSLSLSTYPAGFYFIHVVRGMNTETLKVIKN